MRLRTALCFLACLGIATAQAAEPPKAFTTQADQILTRFTQATGPGAAVTVSRDNQVIYQAARGEASVELHVPMKAGDRFRIGSITKTVTAATVLTLVHQGKLSLTDPLAKFLPDFPGASGITIAQLLSHTAGVSDEWNADPAAALDTKTLIGLIAKQPADFKPGSAWRYSNSGYMLLGAVIEKVTGMSWHDAETKFVIAPFGMTHTGYFPDDAVVADAVEGYSADDNGHIARPPFVSITGPMTAGALTSTSGDIAHLAEGLNNPTTFPSAMLKAMTTPAKLADGSDAPYGFGLFSYTIRGEPAYGHNGGIEGFTSQFVYLPKQRVAVAVLVNSDTGTPSARALALQIAAAAIGKPYTTFTDRLLSATERKALVGEYQIKEGQVHAITEEDGELYVQRAPGPKRHLIAAEGDMLYYAGEATDYFHVLKGKDGAITAVAFYTDGMAPARVEKRVGPARTIK